LQTILELNLKKQIQMFLKDQNLNGNLELPIFFFK